MYTLGISFVLLALLSGVPAAWAVDRGVSGLAQPRATGLVHQASSTACPFRRFPWLCHPPRPRRPRLGVGRASRLEAWDALRETSAYRLCPNVCRTGPNNLKPKLAKVGKG